MHRLFLLLAILFSLLFGYQYVCNHRKADCFFCPKSQTAIAPVAPATPDEEPKVAPFRIGGTDIVFDRHPEFVRSAPDIVNADLLSPDFQKVAAYLNQNPDKRLMITGFYKDEEKNGTQFPDLGLARANTVTQLLAAAGVAKDRVFSASKEKPSIVFDDRGRFTNGADISVALSQGLRIMDGDKLVFQSPDDFRFAKGDATPFASPDLENGYKEIAGYFNNAKAKDRTLEVVGYYTAEEGKAVGQQRADAIKRKLVEAGLPADRITTETKLMNGDPAIDGEGKFTGGVGFNVQISEETIADITVKPRTLYFASGKSSLDVNDELRKYFADVKTYLNHPKGANAKVRLTGHTDSDGSDATNMVLGQKRADRVKTELVNIGIPESRIVTESKGERYPVKPNSSPAGKQANRRTEILIVN